MIRFLKQIMGSEKGQALPIVLSLLALGSLTIVPSLNYATTSLNSGQDIEKGIEGIYAADAGVLDTLWCLKNGMSPPEQLAENINQTAVAIQTEDNGIYSLYFGELVQAGQHSDYISVDGEMVWDEQAEAYKYTITVTWQGGTPIIHLEEIGARLPPGYSYQAASAAGFAGNFSTGEPDEVLDSFGAYMLSWEFESPYPSVSETNPVQTQMFYIIGEGSQQGDYTWVVANRVDVGSVGEITGTFYKITATATRPENGEVTAEIMADVLIDGETTYISLWQISN